MEDPSNVLADVLIVNYKSYDELGRCLESLESERSRLEQVLVVDHESDVAAAASLTQRFPWIKLIERSTNEGFATGINLGARLGRAPFLLLLNPDCVVTPSACDRLLQFLVPRVDVAIAGPRILNADGSVQGSARRFPGVTTVIAGRSSWLTRRFPRNPLSRLNLPGLDAGEQPLDVDWVSGACMLVRRSAFEQAGGMDECFFLYLGRRRFLSATVAARMAHDCTFPVRRSCMPVERAAFTRTGSHWWRFTPARSSCSGSTRAGRFES